MAWVWGIDVATGHLAFAFADAEAERRSPTQVATLKMATTAREGERLGYIAGVVRIQGGWLAEEYPPICVWVEQPSGRFNKPQLYYVAGVVQAALNEALRCPVWSVPPSGWKRATVGKGNASKDEVLEWVLDRSQVGVETQHEADAYAIAEAGRAMLLGESWNAAA